MAAYSSARELHRQLNSTSAIYVLLGKSRPRNPTHFKRKAVILFKLRWTGYLETALISLLAISTLNTSSLFKKNINMTTIVFETVQCDTYTGITKPHFDIQDGCCSSGIRFHSRTVACCYRPQFTKESHFSSAPRLTTQTHNANPS